MPRYYYGYGPDYYYGPYYRPRRFWGLGFSGGFYYDEVIVARPAPPVYAPPPPPPPPGYPPFYVDPYSPAYSTDQLAPSSSYSPSYSKAPAASSSSPRSATKRYYVAVPTGVSGGEVFRASLDGSDFDVTCPKGSKAGDLIIVTAPAISVSGQAPVPEAQPVPAASIYVVGEKDAADGYIVCRKCTAPNLPSASKCAACTAALPSLAAGGGTAAAAAGGKAAAGKGDAGKGWFGGPWFAGSAGAKSQQGAGDGSAGAKNQQGAGDGSK